MGEQDCLSCLGTGCQGRNSCLGGTLTTTVAPGQRALPGRHRRPRRDRSWRTRTFHLPPARPAGVPDGQEVPQVAEAAPAPRPWYRRPRPLTAVIAAVVVLLGTLAVVLSLTVLADNPPSGMAAVLAKDGYPVSATFTKDQLDQLGAFSGTDGAAMKPFVTGAAMGVKHGNEEVVIQLTPDYGAIMRAGLPSMMGQLGLPQGVTAHMAGNDLVYDGPVATLGPPPGVSAT